MPKIDRTKNKNPQIFRRPIIELKSAFIIDFICFTLLIDLRGRKIRSVLSILRIEYYSSAGTKSRIDTATTKKSSLFHESRRYEFS